MSKDDAVRAVAAELNTQMNQLQDVVAALTAILLPPEADPAKERMPSP